jgi:hypothetical protein
MRRRSKRERQTARRALDYRAMMSLDGEVLRVVPFVNAAAATVGTVASPEQGHGGLVTVYDVVCEFPLPVSISEALCGITTRLDISGDQYPRSAPIAFVVSPEKPFSTHVEPGGGAICIGDLWDELKGKELLAELVLRIVRAYNFQCPPANEYGYQRGAHFYFKNFLHERPFNPDLELPAVPEDVFQLPTAPRPRVLIVAAPRPWPSETRVRVTGSEPRRLVVVRARPS